MRIHSPDGVFLLLREPKGLTDSALLERLKRSNSEEFFDPEGGQEIEETSSKAKPARSPWEH